MRITGADSVVTVGGLIFKALQRHIMGALGPDQWDAIVANVRKALPKGTIIDWSSGVGLPELLKFAAEALATSPDELLETAARGWVDRSGLPSAAIAPRGALTPTRLKIYTNSLGNVFPFLKPPVLVSDVDRQGATHLRFYCYRGGFTPFVQGLLAGAAFAFDPGLAVTLTVRQADGGDHDDFLLGPAA